MMTVRLVVISGVSGAGKTTAVHALEDLGYFCVDNLPPPLLPNFVDLITRPGSEVDQVALVMDARERRFLAEAPAALDFLDDPRISASVMFLDCRDDILIRRFSETRRMHPLAPRSGVTEGIALERDALIPFRDRADLVIDTSDMTVHQLASEIKTLFDIRPREDELTVTITSFGFRYGIPISADLVFDARFLPNPHFVPQLKDFTGLDLPVVNFFEEKPEVGEFEQKLFEMLDYLLPRYQREGKTYLTIAIGCTGGKHRSVYLAERLGERLVRGTSRIRVRHRELTRGFG
jgi:RNase adapter protein RapZ